MHNKNKQIKIKLILVLVLALWVNVINSQNINFYQNNKRIYLNTDNSSKIIIPVHYHDLNSVVGLSFQLSFDGDNLPDTSLFNYFIEKSENQQSITIFSHWDTLKNVISIAIIVNDTLSRFLDDGKLLDIIPGFSKFPVSGNMIVNIRDIKAINRNREIWKIDNISDTIYFGVNLSSLNERDKIFNAINIFPTVSNSTINVFVGLACEGVGLNYKIMNSIGSIIFEGEITTSESIIDVSKLEPGLYLISVFNYEGQEIKVEKIICSSLIIPQNYLKLQLVIYQTVFRQSIFC